MLILGELPKCPRCHKQLLPLSDENGQAFKAWVCADEACGWGLAIDHGVPGYIEQVGPRQPKRGRERQ
jgi:hypothetical protein